jgi:hypothetical protein
MRLSGSSDVTPQYQYYGIWLTDKKEWVIDSSFAIIAAMSRAVIEAQIAVLKDNGYDTSKMEVKAI